MAVFNQVGIKNIPTGATIPLNIEQKASGWWFALESNLSTRIYFVSFIVDIENNLTNGVAAPYAGAFEIPNSRSYSTNTRIGIYGQSLYPLDAGPLLSLRNVSTGSANLRTDGHLVISYSDPCWWIFIATSSLVQL